jgi:predicted TIM-barrel fold metal-dependent hydrolase
MTPSELVGRINDVDSHEQIMLSHWGETFGEVGAQVRDLIEHWFVKILKDAEKAATYVEVEVEQTPIDQETLRTVRGSAAPGAMSFDRRIQVMDLEGIQRQLVFPFFGLWAPVFDATPVEKAAEMFGLENATPKTLEELSQGVQKAYNGWAAEQTRKYGGRIRPAGILRSKCSLDQLIRDTEEIFASGLSSVMVPAALPPAGMSPADEALDPFWSMCAEADAPVLIHLGDERAYRASDVWGELPVFQRQPTETNEVPLDPYTLSTAHHPAENFLTTMLLSGVFERHPTLRFGLIELGAEWIGPLSARLDMWAEQFSKRMAKITSMKPSEYINRNTRISAFHFEPVHQYVEMYGLEDVYCYATDYPHNEGGKDPLGSHLARFEGVSESFQEKFFVKNAELLLPG